MRRVNLTQPETDQSTHACSESAPLICGSVSQSGLTCCFVVCHQSLPSGSRIRERRQVGVQLQKEEAAWKCCGPGILWDGCGIDRCANNGGHARSRKRGAHKSARCAWRVRATPGDRRPTHNRGHKSSRPHRQQHSPLGRAQTRNDEWHRPHHRWVSDNTSGQTATLLAKHLHDFSSSRGLIPRSRNDRKQCSPALP